MLHGMHSLKSFKEKYREEFCLLVILFLHDKPKFLTLVADEESQEDDASE